MNVTVTVSVNGETSSIGFKVLEPLGVDHAYIYAYPGNYRTNDAAAGMVLRVVFGPTNVSFYRIQFKEVERPPSMVTGYFTRFPMVINHWGWTPVAEDNSWPLDDRVNTGDTPLPPPWDYGSIHFEVPAMWKIGDDGTSNYFTNGWSQSVSNSPLGTITVEKFGHWAARATNNVYTFSPGDPHHL